MNHLWESIGVRLGHKVVYLHKDASAEDIEASINEIERYFYKKGFEDHRKLTKDAIKLLKAKAA